MNSHKRWAQKMMAKPMPLTAEIEAQGADRERRRIRRAQEYGVSIVRTFSTTEHFALPESAKALLASAVEILDAATRTKKGKRK